MSELTPQEMLACMKGSHTTQQEKKSKQQEAIALYLANLAKDAERQRVAEEREAKRVAAQQRKLQAKKEVK